MVARSSPRADSSDQEGAILALLRRLLEATEELHAGAAGEASIEALERARAQREQAYQALVERVDPERFRPNAAMRACLERIRVLDAQLVELGRLLPDALRNRRLALKRRGSVVKAHASRERGEPRVVAVKA